MPAPSLQAAPPTRSEARKILREKVAVGVYRRATSDGRTRYEINYLDRAGKLKWETVGDNLAEAKRRRAKLNSKRPEERRAPSRETFADLAELWFEQKAPRLRERTRSYYRDALDLVLLPHFGRIRLAQIDADSLAGFIRALQTQGLHAVDAGRSVRPLSKSSVANYCKPLAATLAFAARRGVIPVNPWSLLTSDDMPTRGEERTIHEWTTDEISSLLAASRRLAETKGAPEARPYNYEPLLRVAVVLGLRLGECLGLRWEDFDKDAGVLRVERQWLRTGEHGPTKTKAGRRSVALPADLRDELIALRLRSPFSSDESPIFASMTGTPLQHRNVARRGFEAARDEAGLDPDLTFHDLRHAAASRMIDAGLDPVTVAGVLGHEDPHVTLKIYAARFDRQAKDDLVRAALAGVASGD